MLVVVHGRIGTAAVTVSVAVAPDTFLVFEMEIVVHGRIGTAAVTVSVAVAVAPDTFLVFEMEIVVLCLWVMMYRRHEPLQPDK